MALLCGACSGEQAVAHRAGEWLDLLVARRDGEAMALVADSRIGAEIDEEAFGRLVDRHAILRTHDRVEWSSIAIEGRDFRPFVRPIWTLDGTLHHGADAHRLRGLIYPSGEIGAVRIDERPLMPPVYQVAPTPPPEPLTLADPEAVVEGGRLRVRGRTRLEPGAVTVRLSARCRYGSRWYRAVLDRPRRPAEGEQLVEGAVSLEEGAPDLCEAELSVLQTRTRTATFCWTPRGTSLGACSEAPAGRPGASPPVEVTEVEVRGSSVYYRLTAHEALPDRSGPGGAWISTLVSCPDGKGDEHMRPIGAGDLAPGEHRRYGSIFSPSAWPTGFPDGCDVQLRYRSCAGENATLWQGASGG